MRLEELGEAKRHVKAETLERALGTLLPQAEPTAHVDSSTSIAIEAMSHVDPMVLWGAWPGNEPIEELLAQLD